METVLFALIVFLLAAVGLSVGVLMGRPPIKGSCGGIGCSSGGNCAVCPKRSSQGEP